MDVRSLLKKHFPLKTQSSMLLPKLSWESAMDSLKKEKQYDRLESLINEIRSLVIIVPEYTNILSDIALLHDIGCKKELKRTSFHPLDGALYAAQYAYPEQVLKGILLHSFAKYQAKILNTNIKTFYEELDLCLDEADQQLIDLFTFIEINTSLDGVPTSAEQNIFNNSMQQSFNDILHGNLSNYSNLVYDLRYKILKLIRNKINALPWLFLDIDNTLVAPGNLIGEKTVNAIKDYVSSGGKVSLVTGKIPIAFKKTIKELNISHLPHIGGNGAIIRMNSNNNIIGKLGSLSAEMIPIIEGLNINYFLYEPERILTTNVRKNCELSKYLLSVNEPEPFSEKTFDSSKIIKILMFVDESDYIMKNSIKNMLSPWENQITLTQTSPELLEINSITVNKGAAIRRIAASYNHYYRYSVAVGDSENDLHMLNSVGLPYLVNNASDQMKNIGFATIPSCDEQGVATLIESLLDKMF